MGSQLFYVGTFSFEIYLQRSLAVFKYSKFELSGFQKYEQPTKVFCLTENFLEYFSEIKLSSNLKKFCRFEVKRIVWIFLATSTIKKYQAAQCAAFIFYGGTKPQGFTSRGDSRSSLKTEGFLHIFTNSRKPCL